MKPKRKAHNRKVPQGAEKEILKLYEEGVPIKEIAKKYNIVFQAIYTYIPLKKRDRLGGYPKGWTREKIRDVSSMSELEKMGLILYAAEGAKRGWRIDLANSNPALGRLHIRWLIECYGVSRSKLQVRLTIHEDRNYNKCLSYWSKELQILPQQFLKPDIRECSKEKPPHPLYKGTLQIRYSSAKLFRLISERLLVLLNSVASKPKGSVSEVYSVRGDA